MSSRISRQQVKHVAQLANLPITENQETELQAAFEETLGVIDNLQQVDTTNVEPTSQVTGLENIWREDRVDEERMFSQKEALANARQQHQGYFVVPRILDND